MNRTELALVLIEAIRDMKPGGGPLKLAVFWLYLCFAHLLLCGLKGAGEPPLRLRLDQQKSSEENSLLA